MSRGPDGCVMPLLQPRPSGKAGRGGHPMVAGGVFAPAHVLAEAIRRRELSSDLTMSNRPGQRGSILARKVATPSMEGPHQPAQQRQVPGYGEDRQIAAVEADEPKHAGKTPTYRPDEGYQEARCSQPSVVRRLSCVETHEGCNRVHATDSTRSFEQVEIERSRGVRRRCSGEHEGHGSHQSPRYPGDNGPDGSPPGYP
jgi:hypothetical protein